jgi:ATP-dependent Zn protease
MTGLHRSRTLRARTLSSSPPSPKISWRRPVKTRRSGPTGPREFSEETAREIDCAVRGIINAAFEKAVNILKVRREVLEQGAQLLLQKETLVEEDLKALKRALPAVA